MNELLLVDEMLHVIHELSHTVVVELRTDAEGADFETGLLLREEGERRSAVATWLRLSNKLSGPLSKRNVSRKACQLLLVN